MQKHLQEQITLSAQYSNVCPKCGSELHVSWCERCFGTGKSGQVRMQDVRRNWKNDSLPECSLTQTGSF